MKKKKKKKLTQCDLEFGAEKIKQLRGLYSLGRLSYVVYKEDNFCKLLFSFLSSFTLNPFLKRVYFFPFRANMFTEGGKRLKIFDGCEN